MTQAPSPQSAAASPAMIRLQPGDDVPATLRQIEPWDSPGFSVPTVKIASNTELAKRKKGWIDSDAGQALAKGTEPAGDSTAAEAIGEREVAIWKRGVTL